MTDSLTVQERAASIKLLLMDCDGVLTDGRIWILGEGEDQKAFHTHDGLGFDLLHRAGIRSGIISGRSSSAVDQRARALGVSFIHLGSNEKLKAFAETLVAAEVTKDEVAYIGDDLNDIPLMLRSRLAVAVANATAETLAKAHYVTKSAGGKGAVREVIELILKAQNRWAEMLEHYS